MAIPSINLHDVVQRQGIVKYHGVNTEQPLTLGTQALGLSTLEETTTFQAVQNYIESLPKQSEMVLDVPGDAVVAEVGQQLVFL